MAHELTRGASQPGHTTRLTSVFRVEVNGLEPSASTLRIQTGPFADLDIYEKGQLDRHFGRPLPTIVDPHYPPNRARIAHETAMAEEYVRIETWTTFDNSGDARCKTGI
jgi:hypothetical protein